MEGGENRREQPDHSRRVKMGRGRGSVKGRVREEGKARGWKEKEMHQMLHAEAVQLECGSMRIEVIL